MANTIDFTNDDQTSVLQAEKIVLPKADKLDQIVLREVTKRQTLINALQTMQEDHDFIKAEQAIKDFNSSNQLYYFIAQGKFFSTAPIDEQDICAEAFKTTIATPEEQKILDRCLKIRNAASQIVDGYFFVIERILGGLIARDGLKSVYRTFVFSEVLMDFSFENNFSCITNGAVLLRNMAKDINIKKYHYDRIWHSKPELLDYTYPKRERSLCVDAWTKAVNEYFNSNVEIQRLFHYVSPNGIQGPSNQYKVLDDITKEYKNIKKDFDEAYEYTTEILKAINSINLLKDQLIATCAEIAPIIEADGDILAWLNKLLTDAKEEQKKYESGDNARPYSWMKYTYYEEDFATPLKTMGISVTLGDPKEEGTKYYTIIRKINYQIKSYVDEIIENYSIGHA